MAYTPFVESTPNPTTQSVAGCFDSDRENLLALRDAIIVGTLAGWSMTPAGGTSEEPATLTYAKGTERIRATMTWSGGKVISVLWAYSSNSGTLYDSIGTEAISYDASDNVTGITWS